MKLYSNKKVIVCFLAPALIMLGVFIYYPLIQAVIGSLYQWNAYLPDRTWVGLGNYLEIFKNPNLFLAIRNNILYAIISVVCQVFLAMVLAACIEEAFMRKFQKFFRSVLFLPSLISMAIIALLWKQLFNPNIGLINAFIHLLGFEDLTPLWLGDSKLAIFCCIFMSQWQYTGYCMMLDLVGIQKIPQELYESAELDGASPIQKFFKVTLPLAKESMLVTSIITIIGSFKVFTEIQVMTGGGPGHASEVLATLMYKEAFKMNSLGTANAYAFVIFIVTLVLSIIQIRLSNSGKDS